MRTSSRAAVRLLSCALLAGAVAPTAYLVPLPGCDGLSDYWQACEQNRLLEDDSARALELALRNAAACERIAQQVRTGAQSLRDGATQLREVTTAQWDDRQWDLFRLQAKRRSDKVLFAEALLGVIADLLQSDEDQPGCIQEKELQRQFRDLVAQEAIGSY